MQQPNDSFTVVDRFKAKSTSDPTKIYEIIHRQQYLASQRNGLGVEAAGGETWFELTTGKSVTPLDNGEFEIDHGLNGSERLVRIW